MRIALVSDIHGNLPALEAVIEDTRRRAVTAVVNLGDSLSGPLLPLDTARFLMKQDWVQLAGNHERQLLEGHFYLATSLLCAFAALAAVESSNSRVLSIDVLTGLLVAFAGSAVGVWAFMRYVRMLRIALHAAERSVCAQCKTYGLLEATGAAGDPRRTNADLAIMPTPVRCRKCGHQWTIA